MIALLQGETVILNCADVVLVGAASVTLTVKANVPVEVGLPEITPVVFNVNPGGSAPVARTHE